ncbi:phosphomannose isomerase type II C-terminal cupin domain [Deltaproteobacteria bacterium TL4]
MCEDLELLTEHRPWGYYVVLADEEDHKVKRIVVYPGKRLSLQRHLKRAEHWYVLAGNALVTLDDQQIRRKSGESVDIPQQAKHRIENQGSEDMSFIEIQTGTYFGEDDIERFEDDFGRL